MTVMLLDWVASAGTAYDSDAQTYITAVEAADSDVLEVGVKDAINDFVVGCKADGIWSAIKASCILAGARTLNGALVPLVGTAPTNNNFVSGDYNRETGLLGDGSTKYINSNRSHTIEPQDSRHIAAYSSSVTDALPDDCNFIGTLDLNNVPGRSGMEWNTTAGAFGLKPYLVSNNAFTINDSLTGAIGFLGLSRATSTNVVRRFRGSSANFATTSASPSSGNYAVFARLRFDTGSVDARLPARLSFYSIGESLDLALLDSRVSTLMTDIAAAIP